jgi:autotransporter-associated beta strand protein
MSKRGVWNLAVGLLLVGVVQAQTIYTFTNNIGNWNVASNWLEGAAPTPGTDVNIVFTNITGVSAPTTNNFAGGSALGWITFQGPVAITNRAVSGSYLYIAGISNEASSVGSSVWDIPTVFTNPAASIVNNGGTFIYRATITNHSALTIDNSGLVSNYPTALITGTGSLNKIGSGTLLLYGANTFTGGFTNNSGITRLMGANVGMSGGVVQNGGLVDIRNSSSLGTGAFVINGGTNDTASANGITNAQNNLIYLNNSFVFTGTKTLALGSGTVTLGTNLTIKVSASTLNFGGAITGLNNGVSLNALDITKEGSGTLLLGSTAPITLRSGQTNTVTAGTMILAAPIGDGGANYDLTVMGAGNLMLLGNNTYGGATRVSGGGGIYFNNNNGLGTGNLAYASGSSFFQLGNGVTISNKTVSINGNGSTFGVIQATNNGTATWAGGVVIDDTVAGQPRVGAQTGGTLTISGPISNGTGTNLYIGPNATGGKVIISGTNNTYSGLTSIIRGTLQLGATDALPTNTILEVRYSSTSSDPIVFDMNGFSQAVAVFKDSQAGYNVMTTNTQAGLSTLTLNQDLNSTYRYTIGGNIALVKNGTGTLTLSGTNSYTGGTTINAGNILFGSTNAIASSSSLLVGSGAGVGVTYAMNQDFLGRINPASAGVAVMGASTASNLDFSAATGASLTNISLGAFGTVTNSGGIIPFDTTYRLGGGGGTNTLINVDQLTGGNNLVAFGGGSGGMLNLSASNSFTGGTLINAGTVQIKDVNALGTGFITNNGTLQFKNTSTVTSPLASISGTGVVDYNGSVVYMLASNSYSGGTLLSLGNVRVAAGDDDAFGPGTITMSGSSSAISSTGSEVRVLANNLIISNKITLGNSTDNGPLTFNGAVDLGGGVRQVTISSPVTINGIISNGGWTNLGGSTLTLTATNTYAGGTTLAGGTLSIGSYSNLPAAGGLLFKGGTLQITGTEITDLGVYNPNWNSFAGGLDVATSANLLSVTNDITLASTLTKAGTGSLVLFQATNGGFAVNNGTLILTGATDNANTYATVNSNATLVLAKESSGTVHALNYAGSTLCALLINQGGAVVLAGTGGDQIPDVGRPGAMTNNGVFNLNGNSEIVAAFAGSGVVTNSSATLATLSVNTGGAFTYSGDMTGAINIQQLSNGVWTVSGNNNITGVTGANGTILLSGNNNLGNVTVNAGVITLSGSNMISDGVTLNGGTLNMNNAYALGTNTMVINGGVLNNTSGGTLTNFHGGAYRWNGDFTFTGSGNLALGFGAVTLGNNVTITNSGASSVLAIDGVIGDGVGGPYSLTKAGAGTLVLRNGNTFAGGLVLNAGTQRVEHAGALGTGTFTINGGVLDSYYGDLVLNPTPMTWNGNFAFAGTSNLNLGAGAVTLGNNIVLTNKNRTLTIGGSIGDGGLGYGLTIAGGAGAVVLANTNTYTGLTAVNTANTLVLRSTNGPAIVSLQIGSGGANAYVRLEADQQIAATNVPVFNGAGGSNLGRLIMVGHTQTLAGLDDPSGKGLLENNDQPGGYFAFYADTNAGPALVIVSNSANYAFAGFIRNYYGGLNGPSNTLSLVKDGSGSQALVGGNITYTGPTLVQNGTLLLSNTSGFASSVLITGGQLALATTAAINAKPITNNAVNGMAFLNTNAFTIGGLSGSGSVVLTNDAGAAVTLTIAGTGTLAGALEDAGNLIITSGANQTLAGANTFSGGVKLNGGRLNLNSSGALGTGTFTFGPVASTLDNTSGGAVTNLNNNPIVLSNALYFTGSSDLHLGYGPMTIADGGHSINVTNNSLTIGGVISDGATSAYLTKAAAGVLVLTGTNIYTGNTTINAGTLRADIGIGIPTTGNLDVNGGLLETGVAVTNAVGGAAGEIRLRGSTAGISAFGTPVTVNLGNAGGILTNGNANFNPSTLVLNGATATDILTLQNGIDLGSNSLTIAVNAQTAIISGDFTNNNAVANNTVTKNGAGTLVLAGNNFFRSNVTANAGTLLLTGNTHNVLGTLTVGSLAGTSASLVVSNGTQLVSGSGAVGSGSGNNNNTVLVTDSGTTWNLGSGALNVGATSSSGSVLCISSGALVSGGQMRSGAGANAVGNSILVTNGGQLVANGFIIGRATFAHSNLLYVGGAGATINNTNGTGRLDIGGYAGDVSANVSQLFNRVVVDLGGVMTNKGNANIGAGSNAVNNGLLVVNGGQFVSQGAAYIGYSGGGNSNWANVSGAGSLWNMSGQTLTIGNIASATGNYLTVASGGVVTNGLIALGGTDSSVRFNGGRFAAGANGNLISGTGSVLVQSGGATLDSAGFLVTNLLALTEDPTSIGGGLTKLGAGTLALSGTNTYSGATVVSNGQLTVVSGGSLSSSTALYVDNLGIVDFSGNIQAIAGLSGNGVVTNGGGSLTLNLAGANNFGGTLKGISALTLTGGGSLLMTGTNSFSGATLVSNASYRVNGLHNGGVITVISNGFVGGSGPLSTLYVDNGGTYAPGNSIATQYVASLTLTNAGVLEMELGAAAQVNDRTIVTNSLTIAGGLLKLNLAAYSFVGGADYTLVVWGGASGFNPLDSAQWLTLSDVGSASNGLLWIQGATMPVVGGSGTTNLFTINYDDVANGHAITLTAVPEPGTASLLALTGLAFLARHLRRRFQQ